MKVDDIVLYFTKSMIWCDIYFLHRLLCLSAMARGHETHFSNALKTNSLIEEYNEFDPRDC